MLLGEPQRTQYDLNFGVLGFRVRVCPFFWLAALLLGQGAAKDGLRYLFLWIAAMFLSILIHELGHALAFRYYGTSSHIVLYHFGGLAVADGFDSPWKSNVRRRNPRSDIVISAAGPGAEMFVALVVILVLAGMGYRAPGLPGVLERFLPLQGGAQLKSAELDAFLYFFIFISIYWALLNLLPVFPLDGGQIARELFTMFGGAQAVPQSLMLSVGTAGAICIWAMTRNEMFLAIMFGLLAYSSYQTLQQYSGRGGGYGSPW